MQVNRVVMTTRDLQDPNTIELKEFYENKLKVPLEIKQEKTIDDLIDIEFYGTNEENPEETLLDKIGIPYANTHKTGDI